MYIGQFSYKGGGRLALGKLSSEAKSSVHGLLASHNLVGQSGKRDGPVGDGSLIDSRHEIFHSHQEHLVRVA